MAKLIERLRTFFKHHHLHLHGKHLKFKHGRNGGNSNGTTVEEAKETSPADHPSAKENIIAEATAAAAAIGATAGAIMAGLHDTADQTGKEGDSQPSNLDDLDKALSTANDAILQGSQKAPDDAVLDNIEERYINPLSETAEKTETAQEATEKVKAVLEAIGAADVIESGIHKLVEEVPVFMKALDEVAKIHPFIGVAVIAFKAVYTLEMTRRDNEKKTIALFAEMKNMMDVLRDLGTMSKMDVQKPAPGGRTMADRLKELCLTTSEDIKSCSNACNTYRRKRLLVKLLNGPVWDTKLGSFAAKFVQRRSEFEFALSIYNATGIVNANQTLANLEKTTQEANARMELLLKAFERLIPDDQKEAKAILGNKDLNSLAEDDDALEELLQNKALCPEPDSHYAKGNRPDKRYGLDDLKQDLREQRENLDSVLDKNMKKFSRKFDIQVRQIKEEIRLTVRREGDRIIKAFTSGPHERIRNTDIHKLWVDMGWKGNVKARHFALALRDYFLEKKEASKNPDRDTTDKPPTSSDGQPQVSDEIEDEWALQYLDIKYLEPVLEAFDTDSSGFVTVNEVNKFTTARPEGWSLLRWIAFWALGINMTMCAHSRRIQEIFNQMFSLLPDLLLENQASASHYLGTLWTGITTVTTSLKSLDAPDSLEPRFKSYINDQLQMLMNNLEDVHFDIDEASTIPLVTGSSRIEKTFFPLTRLLLERHLQKFYVARSLVLDEKELYDACESLSLVNEAMTSRLQELQTTFKYQPIDLKDRFKKYAFGMFEYLNDPSLLWSSDKVKLLVYEALPFVSSPEAEAHDVDKILSFGVPSPIALDTAAYDIAEPTEAPLYEHASEMLKPIVGQWTCMIYKSIKDEYVSECLYSLNLRPVEPKAGSSDNDSKTDKFEAEGATYSGDAWKVEGSCIQGEDGIISVKWRRTYPGNHRKNTERWFGEYNPNLQTLTGSWGPEENASDQDGRFYLSRAPSEILAGRPAPSAFQSNRTKALWAYACNATRLEVRRRSYSWASIREWLKSGHRYVELSLRADGYGRSLDDDETKEHGRLRQYMGVTHARFYASRIKQMERLAIHSNHQCDCCSGYMVQDRVICLQCNPIAAIFDPIDFCGDNRCLGATIHPTLRSDLPEPHLPQHIMVKVRKVVLLRHFGKMYKAGLDAVERSKAVFLRYQEQEKEQEQEIRDIVLTNGLDSKPKNERSGILELLGMNYWLPSYPSPPDEGVVIKPAPRPALTCLKCNEPVKQPCWYCMDCEDTTFICMACDPPGGFSKNQHRNTHTLVTCQQDSFQHVEITMESRLDSLTSHMSSLDERISSMDNRMTKIEGMLQTISLRVDQRPADILSELSLWMKKSVPA